MMPNHSEIMSELQSINSRIGVIESKIDDTKEMVEIWTTLKTSGRFVKWISSCMILFTAIWSATKLGFVQFFR